MCLRKLNILEDDLKDYLEEIEKEWHPTKNGRLKLNELSINYSNPVWWQCSKHKNHEWKATIKNRLLLKEGCRICNFTKLLKGYNDLATTDKEIAKYWDYKKNKSIFPREITKISTKRVWWKCENGHDHSFLLSVNKRFDTSCLVCSDNQVERGFNDLATKRKDIAMEWHPTKNIDLKPRNVTTNSKKLVWWQCSKHKNHEWKETIISRCKKEEPICPICAGQKLLKGYNDLATKRPEVANLWDYERNGTLYPSNVLFNSSYIVAFKCTCGHKWKTKISKVHRCNKCKKSISEIIDIVVK